MAKQPCSVCGTQDRRPGGVKCEECWLSTQPIAVRQKAAEWRLSAIPTDLRLDRVSKNEWPTGRRWCSGCQSFVRLREVSGKASRCKTCNSIAAHGNAIEKKYVIHGRPFTAEDYAILLREQHGRCYICEELPKTRRLAVDHDHETNEVRGLLCADSEWGCNYALLGKIKTIRMAKRIVEHLVDPIADRVLP